MKSIQQYTLAMLLFSLDQLQQIEAKDGEVGETNAAQTMTYLNARFWVLVIFIVLALVSAYKIASDNEPDTAKDSILYAKFL